MSGFDSLPDDAQQRLRMTAELAEQARQRLWAKNAHDPELLALLDLAVGNSLWLLAQVEILRTPAPDQSEGHVVWVCRVCSQPLVALDEHLSGEHIDCPATDQPEATP